MNDRNLTDTEKSNLIALFRAEIQLQRTLSLLAEQIASYCHFGDFSIDDIEECERIAQEQEL